MTNVTRPAASASFFSKNFCTCCRLHRNGYIVTAFVFVLVGGTIVNHYLLSNSRQSMLRRVPFQNQMAHDLEPDPRWVELEKVHSSTNLVVVQLKYDTSSKPSAHSNAIQMYSSKPLALFPSINATSENSTNSSMVHTMGSSSSEPEPIVLEADYCKRTLLYQVIKTTPTPLTLFHHNTSEDVHVSKSIVKSDGDPSRVFESGERQILLNELLKTRDPLILDIGANIGVFALFFAHAGYRVHAFEPWRKNYQLLQCSILVNQFNQSQLTLNTFGLSTQKEPFCLSTPGSNQGGTFVNGKNCSQDYLASFERLDTYLETHLKGEVPYMIKIDTEGHEYLALSPAKEYFRKYGTPKYILSEFYAKFLRRAGTDPDDYFNFFWDLGMTIMHKGKEVKKGNEEYRYLLEADYLSPSNIHVYLNETRNSTR